MPALKMVASTAQRGSVCPHVPGAAPCPQGENMDSIYQLHYKQQVWFQMPSIHHGQVTSSAVYGHQLFNPDVLRQNAKLPVQPQALARLNNPWECSAAESVLPAREPCAHGWSSGLQHEVSCSRGPYHRIISSPRCSALYRMPCLC